MKFEKQIKNGESTLYVFRDVDTNEEKVIEQYY